MIVQEWKYEIEHMYSWGTDGYIVDEKTDEAQQIVWQFTGNGKSTMEDDTWN